MDILTERGQRSLAYEREMLDKIRHTMCDRHKSNSHIIETNKNVAIFFQRF